MTSRHFLAFDLGAESGRAVVGTLDDGQLRIRELHRFPNGMVNVRGHWHWNVFRLYEEIKRGLKMCAAEVDASPASLAVDTWGVDFGLVARDGSILGLPYTYRDARTVEAMADLAQRISRERLYELTGVQWMSINSLFQLYAFVRERSPLLEAASDLLFVPDLFTYLLTGRKATEFTFATTSQLYDPRRRDWSDEVFALLGVSRSLVQEIVSPGTVIGPLDPAIAQETGLGPAPVVATASHDTAAAVAAVPAQGEDWAYISSGTWSLMGVETRQPIITAQAQAFNFTNEGGVAGTFRFLQNITGLWLVQQCRRAWAVERAYSYEELAQMAANASPFVAVVDPNHAGFLNPPDMPAAIRQFCQDTGQPAPDDPAVVVRCILESLALKYRAVLEQLRQTVPHPIHRIHVVGGGARNELLCQFTADATGLPVIAGPTEATAVGNILVQALALGHVSSPSEIRAVVRDSFALQRYEPRSVEPWDAAYARFRDVVSAGA